MDLPAIVAAQLEETITSGKNVQEVVAGNEFRSQKLLQGVQRIYDTVAKDQATVKAAEIAAKLNTQNATTQVVQAIGADPVNPANILVDLAMKKQAAIKETNKSFEELHRRADIGITDDFMGFLSAQFGGVAEARRDFRKNLGTSQLITSQVEEINKIVLAASSVYKAAEGPITAAAAEAATRLAAAEANANVQKIALESVKSSTEAMLRSQQLTKEQLSLLFQAQNAEMAVTQHNLALKQFSFQREKFEWEKEERKILNEARLEGKQMEEHVLENINVGYAALGLPPVEPREAKFIIAQFKAGKAELLEMYDRGRATKVTGVAMIGTSAADSVDALTAHPEAQPGDSKIAAIRLINAARNAVMSNPKYMNEKNKKVVDKAINDMADSLMEQQYVNVTKNPDNIFYVGDLKQYLGSPAGDPRQIPPPVAIAISPLYTKLLKPLTDANADMSDPRIVMQMVMKGFKDKTLTFEEAVDISTVYRQAVMINLQAKGLTSLGLVPPKAGRTLQVNMGTFGDKIDVTDPISVSNWLSKELAKSVNYEEFNKKALEYGRTR